MPANPPTNSSNPPDQQQQRPTDAFSRYSNNIVRMKTLLLMDDGDDDVNLESYFSTTVLRARFGATINAQGNASTERKTRLSFEVHPTLLLWDDLNSLFEEEAGNPQVGH